MLTLKNLESFMQLLHSVEKVKRVARLPDATEYSNTAAHSFQLALLAWYIVSSEKLELNLEKILTYALAHDLVEAYSGDTFAFDTEGQVSKKEREAEALMRIENEFPEYPQLINTIHEYELRENPESIFVYALDKLIDPLNSSMETTQSIWKDHSISQKQMHEYKDTKIAPSPLIAKYWNELTQKLSDNKAFFFND